MQRLSEWTKEFDLLEHYPITAEDTADVVIIGAGHAGTCAARSAAEAGLSVIVIDQQRRENQWILGIGEIGHINSQWQASLGVPPVDIDEFVNDWQLRTANQSNYKLVRKYAENCGAAFDWLIEPLSAEERDTIRPVMFPPSKNFPQTTNKLKAWPGTAKMNIQLQNKMMRQSQEIAEAKGTQFHFGMRAVALEKENGSVNAVIASDAKNHYRRIHAGKAVILAAGDYSRNKKMCEDLLAETADLVTEGADFTGHGWDGSGICMGAAVGGRLEPRSHAAMGGNYAFPGFGLIGATATLRVNSMGKRYSNEGFATHVLAAIPGARQPDGMLWGIFDANILEEVTYQAPCHAVFNYADENEVHRLREILHKASIEKAIEYQDPAGQARMLYCEDTLERLAQHLYENPDEQKVFLKEVKRYNQLCAEGKDVDFGKESHLLHPVSTPPYYACGQRKDSNKPGGQSMKILVTVSGLLIDENQQVLDEHYEPITGLYATGNCSGGRFGKQYTTSLPGQSISMAHALGKVLGSYIATL